MVLCLKPTCEHSQDPRQTIYSKSAFSLKCSVSVQIQQNNQMNMLLSTSDWKTVFLRLISLDTKQQRLEQDDFTWCCYAKYGANKHRGSTYRRLFLSQALYYRKKRHLRSEKEETMFLYGCFLMFWGGKEGQVGLLPLCVSIWKISLLIVHVCPRILLHLHFCISLSQWWQKIIFLLLLHSLFALVSMRLNLLVNSNMLLQIVIVTTEVHWLLLYTAFVIERFGTSERKKTLQEL